MDLSPDDIVSYRFKQTLRGYAIDEVDALLDRLADQVERHLAELEQLRERVSVAEAAAEQTRETEGTLQRTLVVAQQAAERNLADASAQADARLAEANTEAERLRTEAAEESERLRTEAAEESERVRAEASEEADRVRADADAAAAETLDEAQRLARREAEAARGRVEEAVRRHAEVMESVSAHRDALRANLATLEELSLSVPPAPPVDLVVGELDSGRDDDDPQVWEHEFAGGDEVAAGSEGRQFAGDQAASSDAADAADAADATEDTDGDASGDDGSGDGDPGDGDDVLDLDAGADEEGGIRGSGDTHRPLQVRIHDDRAIPLRDDAPVGTDGRDGT